MAKNAELASIEFKETEVQLSDELAVYYSNFSSFSISNPDLTIDFGLRDSRVINKKKCICRHYTVSCNNESPTSKSFFRKIEWSN